MPADLRCFIVGENPGDVESAYFYDPTRAVSVRTIVLRELHARRQIRAPDLAAFRGAGFSSTTGSGAIYRTTKSRLRPRLRPGSHGATFPPDAQLQITRSRGSHALPQFGSWGTSRETP